MKKIGWIAGLLLAGATATSAEAGVYGWTIAGPTGFSGSGQFTTEDTPTASPDDVIGTYVGPGYLLTSFTGTFAGKTVELKAWNPDDGPYYADNLFYAFGTYPYVDLDGILFQTLKPNGSVAQVYGLFNSETCDANGCGDVARIGYPHISGGSKLVTFSVTAITPIPQPQQAVPEPASWALMVAGFGLAGGVLRTRRKSAALQG